MRLFFFLPFSHKERRKEKKWLSISCCFRKKKKKWVHFISHWLAWVQKVAAEAEWMERSQKYNNKRCLVRHPWEIRRHFLLEWQLSLKPFRGSAKFSPWWLTSSMRNAALLWACLDLIQRLKTVKLQNSFQFQNGFGHLDTASYCVWYKCEENTL